MYGYCNKLLRINLTDKTVTEESTGEERIKKYLGGSGIATDILLKETDGNTNPLSPDNLLIYMTGPFTGTRVPLSGRHHIVAKSPLTGIFGEGDAGGKWGTMLKRAGYDGIIIKGRSEKPVYISIFNSEVKIVECEELWGKDTYQTDEIMKKKLGKDFEISSIGPAGENQVPIASIMHDGRDARAVGRCGLGAVMGSKNLKAIAVWGNNEIEVFNKQDLINSIKEVVPGIKEKTPSLSDYGTSGGVLATEKIGDFPLKNWTLGNWEKIEKITGQEMAKTILKKKYYCGACVIGCGRYIEINEGKYKGVKGAGPEYETIGTLGGMCLLDDLNGIAYLGEKCNRLGLDTISAGCIIAFGMECYEKGILTEEDIGMPLNWGDADSMSAIIDMIAYSKGIGKLLGQGVKKASEIIGKGSEKFAIHVKGLELPAHDPRCYNSLAVGYATANRGACHLQGASYFFERTAIMPEFGIHEIQDRFGVEGKGILNYNVQNLMCILDSLKLCKFIVNGGVYIKTMLDWYYMVTGIQLSTEELLKIGERIFTAKRLYNTKCGITAKDDTIPERILKEKRGTGGSADNLPPLEPMLKEYYKIRRWDENGIPTDELLKELDLL